jgi:hypothetical protein
LFEGIESSHLYSGNGHSKKLDGHRQGGSEALPEFLLSPNRLLKKPPTIKKGCHTREGGYPNHQKEWILASASS